MQRKLHQNGQRHCASCGEWKPLDAYHRNKRSWDGLHAYCKACMGASARMRYEKDRERLLELGKVYRAANRRKRRDTQLKVQFGSSLDEYEAILERQGGVCAICGEKGNGSLHLDHRHSDGGIRGLLCFRCNGALGAFRDSENLLGAAIEYLRRHGTGGVDDALPVRVQRNRSG